MPANEERQVGLSPVHAAPYDLANRLDQEIDDIFRRFWDQEEAAKRVPKKLRWEEDRATF